jgi:GT2 family glycosyltransferase
MEGDVHIEETVWLPEGAGKKMIYGVVVTYNGSKWLDRCIYSLVNSSVSINVIVVDNGSSDGTPEKIRRNYPEVELIEAHQNLGFGKANNIGLKKAYDAGADYVFLLNQDAWVETDTIEKLTEIAKHQTEYGVISPIHLNGSGDKLDKYFMNYILPQSCPDLFSDMGSRKLKNKIYRVAFVNAAGWLISRKTIEVIGGFNPIFFAYCEDDNYIHRLRFHGLEIGVYPHSTIYHDREDRPLSVYFTDQFELELRRIMLKYSDPGEENTIYRFIRHLYKKMLLNILRFRIPQIQDTYKLVRILNRLAPDIEEARLISKKTGLSFL